MKNEKVPKPRTTTRKTVAQAIAKQDKEAQQKLSSPVIQEAIRVKAYELYLERGGAPGNDVEDWIVAEQIIMQKYR